MKDFNFTEFVELTDEELEVVDGGISGWFGNLLNGFGNAMNTWNTTGFPTYNIGGSTSPSSNGSIPQYSPYNYWY